MSARAMIILVVSDDRPRVHMALMLAASAAAMGREVTFFISKSAVKLFSGDGWAALGGQSYDDHLTAKGVADFAILLDAVKSLDVRFMACDASLAEHDLSLADMKKTLPIVEAGLASLVEMGSDAQWVTF